MYGGSLAAGDELVMARKLRRFLSTAILYAALTLIALLAVPLCLFLVPIALIWTLTDRALRKLED